MALLIIGVVTFGMLTVTAYDSYFGSMGILRNPTPAPIVLWVGISGPFLIAAGAIVLGYHRKKMTEGPSSTP